MIRLGKILRTSLQDVLKMSSRHLEDVLERCLEDILQTSWVCLGKTSWRHLEDVWKRSWRRHKDVWPRRTYWSWPRRLIDAFWRRITRLNIIDFIWHDQDAFILKISWQDVLKTPWRCPENFLKMYRTRMTKMNILVLTKTSWRRLVKTKAKRVFNMSSSRRIFPGNTSEKILNEIIQIVYLLYRAKEYTKKVYSNIMNSIKL